jgi:hypothetical protein
LPQTLHHELERRADAEGVSLNQYIVYALTRQATPAYTVEIATKEDLQNQRRRFEELLADLRDAVGTSNNDSQNLDESIELEAGLLAGDVERLRDRISTARTAGNKQSVILMKTVT